MLDAILGEPQDPQVLAELARGRLRSKLSDLPQALDGRVQPSHRMLIKGTYLSAFSHRIARRRGKKRALLAVAHTLLVIISHVLKTKKPFVDLGVDYFDKVETSHIQRRAVTRLEQLGYQVTLTPVQVAS